MKIKWPSVLLIVLLLTSCAQKKIFDDTSFVDNSDSKLVSTLLSRDDFNSDWRLGYGELTQHSGGTDVLSADEYASYFLVTTYLPYETYFTFSHEIYLHVNSKIDTTSFLDFERPGFEWTPLGHLGFLAQSTRCIIYNESTKQSCVFVESNDFLTSVLMLTLSSNLSEEQISSALAPIINILEIKFQEYSVK
ncbi:MAG: hypothetical protein JNM55_05875 [Anaerolineales bacterium]|nr:hypothetical protein [Anaerolineales bacterium]